MSSHHIKNKVNHSLNGNPGGTNVIFYIFYLLDLPVDYNLYACTPPYLFFTVVVLCVCVHTHAVHSSLVQVVHFFY